MWLSQTTLSVDETMLTVAALKERFPALQAPPSDDICYATQNRQGAVKAIAPKVRAVPRGGLGELVQLGADGRGGPSCAAHAPTSSRTPTRSTRRGWRASDDLGLSSGASVPEVLVHDVLAWLADHGFGDVEAVMAAEESLIFSLPAELRRDLKARRGEESGTLGRDAAFEDSGWFP